MLSLSSRFSFIELIPLVVILLFLFSLFLLFLYEKVYPIKNGSPQEKSKIRNSFEKILGNLTFVSVLSLFTIPYLLGMVIIHQIYLSF